MKRKQVIVSACLAIGLCGALLFVLWPDSGGASQGDRIAADSPAHRQAMQRRLFTLEELYAEGRARAGQDKLSNIVEAPEPVADLDEAMAEVLDSDPQLRKFHDLRRKALRTSVEQQDYLAMIADAKLITEARDDLLAAALYPEVDQGEELKRLQRIQYLNSAVAWDSNPSRALAVETVRAVLLAKIPAGLSKAAKGSTLGDKFDLFQILMVSDPARAESLLEETRGTALEKIFRLAWQTSSSGRKKNNNL